MSVEVEMHSVKGRRDKFHGIESVESGNCETYDFLKVGEVLVVASINGREASIFVKGEGIKVQRFTMSENIAGIESVDGEPTDVDDGLIKLELGTEILLTSNLGKRSSREMWMWIECDDDDRDFEITPELVPPQLVLA